MRYRQNGGVTPPFRKGHHDSKAVRCHAALTTKATRRARLTSILQQTGVGIGPSFRRALPENTSSAAERIRFHNVFLPEKAALRPVKADLRHRNACETPSCSREILCKRNRSGTFFNEALVLQAPPSRDLSSGSVKLEVGSASGGRYGRGWYFGGSGGCSSLGNTNSCPGQTLLSAGRHSITPNTVAVDSRTFGVPPSKTKA